MSDPKSERDIAMAQQGWRRECDDADELLRLMFPTEDPGDFRTDGGSINLSHVRAALTNTPAGADMTNTPDSTRVVAAARELCRRQSEACNTDVEDGWRLYDEVFLSDARAMLAAADSPGIPDSSPPREAILKALTAMHHMIDPDQVRFFRDPTKDTTALSQLCDSLEAAWVPPAGEPVAWMRTFNGERMGLFFTRTDGLLPGWEEIPLYAACEARAVLASVVHSKPSDPMQVGVALIARHRKACFDFATCEPKDADRLGREVFAAAQALEAALIVLGLPVAYHDKDQPNGIAWCPGYPEKLRDIVPLYAGEPSKAKRGSLAGGVEVAK